MLDPSKILPVLRRVRRAWEVRATPPADLVGRTTGWGPIATLHSRVAERLESAVAAEYALRCEWLTRVRAHVPSDKGRNDIVASLVAARDAADAESLASTPGVRSRFEEA